MSKRTGFYLSLGLLILGLLLMGLGLRHTVTVYFNGKTKTVEAFALRVDDILGALGANLKPSDRIQPPPGTWLGWVAAIRYDQAVPVHLWKGGGESVFLSADRIPANILKQSGVGLFPGDRILWNGQEISPSAALPFMPSYLLQYQPAVEITLVENAKTSRFTSSQTTLGQAFWEQGIQISAGDDLSLPIDTPLQGPLTVVLRRALPLSIQVEEQKIAGMSAAATVGQALAEVGVTLQGMDYSIPDGDQPIPQDGVIKVVRAREEVTMEQTSIPFKNEYVTDPQLGLNERRVLEAGQPGLQISRVRVRFEDGKEVSRLKEAEWITIPPKNQRVALGAKIESSSVASPNGTIEYWRAVTVYATSYSPCRSGGSRCYNYTASGAKAEKGIIGVTSAWYKQLAGLRVYIPGYGYGVIGDIGGGIPGKNWIDLAYSDSDYVPWSQNVTMYFLNPVPAIIPSVP